ncbi:MAG: DUF3298 domain-containing protein [Selenomonadaceae bacterium]|nr:DUF3298 domain-containing protein [Selenomonadaceae bacterium]
MRILKLLPLTLIMIIALAGAVNAKALEPINGFYKKITSHTFSEKGIDLLNRHVPMLCFPTSLETNYPKLVNTLSDYNLSVINDSVSEQDSFIEQAREHHRNTPEYFSAYYSNSDIFMRRADSNVVSFMRSFESYAGGAHGMYGFFGVNFDSATGNRLTISDVCTDANKLYDVIVKRLYADYDERQFDNLENTVMKLIVEDEINFVIEPRGVTFIFNPYEIAPYASGLITATLFFDEHPNLFKPKYRQTLKEYAQSVPLFHEITIDLNGKRAKLSIITEFDKCTVHLNDQVRTFNLHNAQQAVFVHTADGKNYLYVDGVAESDGFSNVAGECLSVLKLDGELELYDRMPYTLRHWVDYESEVHETVWWLMTDPNSIQFDSTHPVGDMYSHFGAVGDNGIFSFG